MAALPQFVPGFAWTALEVKCHEATKATRTREIKAKEQELEADDGTEDDRITGELAALRARTKEQHLADANTGHVIVTKAVNTLLTTLMPNKILQRVKRQLRHQARKPLDMKVKTCLLHVNRINHEEIPELPPNYNTAQSLGPDEVSDILLHRTPKSWQREMDRQGFDPMAKTAQEIVQFMENIEMSKDFDGDNKKKIAQAAGETKKANSKKATKKNNITSGQKFCLLHGNNNTRTTDECDTLKAQAKKLKATLVETLAKPRARARTRLEMTSLRTRPTSPKANLRPSSRKLPRADLSRSSSPSIRSARAILTTAAWTSMLSTLNSRSSITMTWKNLSSRTLKMERSTMPPSLPKCLSEGQARIR